MGKASIAHATHGWTAPISIQPKVGYLPIKRFIDIITVIAIAPIAAFVSAIGMIWVKFDSQGDALFHQKRIGKAGAVFRIHKIRTMHEFASPETDSNPVQDAGRITGLVVCSDVFASTSYRSCGTSSSAI